ncbi:MAG: YggS family pyridoxal phosphate-dependent enzyme [Bacteroidetes bacterium]|nr:YggS family pyridoxal phosphate-dependent enzyme [Bacteroidota bacterium]
MPVHIEQLSVILNELNLHKAVLVAVSKTKPVEEIMAVYNSGHKIFGENYVQELVEKHEQLPKDIQWHFIGHLQSNKVKLIAPFVSLIHSVDSFKLLKEIDKEAKKNNRIIHCLLQVYIAQEETKFGFSFEEAENLLGSPGLTDLKNISIDGFMGMATLTDDENQIRKEFHSLKNFFASIKAQSGILNPKSEILSMGMTSDYKIALEEGSNMVRIGSAIFGERN